MGFIEQHWYEFLLPLSVAAITVLVGFGIRKSLFRVLRQWSKRSATKGDEIVIEAIRGPFMIWVLMLGLHLGFQSSKLPVRAQNMAAQILLVLFMFSMTLVCSRLAGAFARLYMGVFTTLAENLTRGAVLIIGAIVILNTLGFSVLPIRTALGVGGIAVALALQDTLSNLFSGFYISLAGQVRIGDYIKLDSGEEGYISDISWRSTSIRSLQNNVIIIPNAKLAKATITNFNLPEQTMAVTVAVPVTYDSDPERVEAILLDEATKAAEQVPGMVEQPAPFVRLAPGFGQSSLDFTLNCYVRKFADQYLVQHELRKRIFARFRKEQIELPFPTRTVYMHDASETAQTRRLGKSQSV
jgi:small-conductance mechanosensitive channel